MIKMTREQLNHLNPLDEDESIQIQEHCGREIEDVINELYGYLLCTELEEKVKVHLMRGLDHISWHIKGELTEITNEMLGRLN